MHPIYFLSDFNFKQFWLDSFFYILSGVAQSELGQ